MSSSIENKRKAQDETLRATKKRGVIDAASALAALSTACCPEVSRATPVAVPVQIPRQETEAAPVSPENEEKKSNKEDKVEPKTSNRSGDFAKTFPEKLMDILDDEENQQIISWLPHGKSFVIHDPFKLTAEVLPRYHLKKCKFESFTRKLYFWGFRKISQGKDTDAFYNKHFKKGDFPLCRHIRCRNDPEGPVGSPSTTAKQPKTEPVRLEQPDKRVKEQLHVKEVKKARQFMLDEHDARLLEAMRSRATSRTEETRAEKSYRAAIGERPSLLSLLGRSISTDSDHSSSRSRSERDMRLLERERDLRLQRDMGSPRDVSSPRSIKSPRNLSDQLLSSELRSRDISRSSRDIISSRDFVSRDGGSSRNLELSRDFRSSRDFESSRDFRSSRDFESSRDIRSSRDYELLRDRSSRDFESSRDRSSRDFESSRDRSSRDFESSRDSRSSRGFDLSRGSRSSRDFDLSRDSRSSRDFDLSRDNRSSRDIGSPRDTRSSRDLRDVVADREARPSRERSTSRDINSSSDMLRALMLHRRRHESITAAALSSLSRTSMSSSEDLYDRDCFEVSDILRSALDVIGR